MNDCTCQYDDHGMIQTRRISCPTHGQQSDPVDHPPHYGGADNQYEAIKVIDAWDLDFSLGNTVKYIARAGKKGSLVEDLKKAAWYLNHAIKKAETNEPF